MLLSITEFIGHFHPLLVHLPIGILLIGLLLQWLSAKEKYNISYHVIKIVLLCGMLSAVVSCITGYLLSMSGEYDATAVSWHMWMGIAVAVVAMLLYVRVVNKQFDIIYKSLSVGLLILVMITGHLGGSLTHGSDYLSKPLSDIFGADSTAVYKQKPIANIQEAKLYADVIQPMLQSDCYGCHGAQKQKGKLRMDDQTLLMKGGKDGVIITPGKPDESELIKRLLLPREDEHHMPPKEKAQLNEKQIALLHWWIENGADFTKPVKAFAQPDKIKPLLLALQTDHIKQENKMPATIPAAPVEKADEKAVQVLRDKGVVVIPVAQNSNYLMINFVTATSITDKDVALLVPLKKQLVWLKIGHSFISDSALNYIGQCTALTSVQLDNTAITDKGLLSLKTLANLQSLNLVGTKITLAGVSVLKDLKQLRNLYLYQTSIDKKDWPALQKQFPKTALDSGNYSVPIFASDTTLVTPPKTPK